MDRCLIHDIEMAYDFRSGFTLCSQCERSWKVDCEQCGLFNYIGPEPVTCPQCHSTEIDTELEA
jgi:hypothetical protein